MAVTDTDTMIAQSLAWLRMFGCDVSRIMSVRQLNWVLWKFTEVSIHWGLDARDAFRKAWPQMERVLSRVSPDCRLSYAQWRAWDRMELEPFFKDAEALMQQQQATSTADSNVISLSAWRREKQAVFHREDDPLTAA